MLTYAGEALPPPPWNLGWGCSRVALFVSHVVPPGIVWAGNVPETRRLITVVLRSFNRHQAYGGTYTLLRDGAGPSAGLS